MHEESGDEREKDRHRARTLRHSDRASVRSRQVLGGYYVVAGRDLARDHAEAGGERRIRQFIDEDEHVRGDYREIDVREAAQPVVVVIAEGYHAPTIRTRSVR